MHRGYQRDVLFELWDQPIWLIERGLKCVRRSELRGEFGELLSREDRCPLWSFLGDNSFQ